MKKVFLVSALLFATPCFAQQLTVVGSPTNIPLTSLASQATNTVVGNATSGSASPTALAVGTCSTSSSALIWTTNTGFGCNTGINASTLGTRSIGTSGTTVPLNNGANDLSGEITISGSALVTAGVASVPSNGNGTFGVSASVGMILKGKGSAFDLSLINSAGSLVITVPTGTQTVQFNGYGAGAIVSASDGTLSTVTGVTLGPCLPANITVTNGIVTAMTGGTC